MIMKLLSFFFYGSVLTSSLISIDCLAIEPMDQYYADDLTEAVDQAREQPHHYDYSGTYRYKRTTAQSIELNRLDLGELDDTRLEMDAGQPNSNSDPLTDDGKTKDQFFEDTPSKLTSFKSDSSTLTSTNPVLPQGSYYKTGRGEYRTTGIRSSGIVTSTPRP